MAEAVLSHRSWPTTNDQRPTILIRLGFDLRHILSRAFLRGNRLLARASSQHIFHADVLTPAVFRGIDIDGALSRARGSIPFSLLRRAGSGCQVGDLLVGHKLRAFSH